MDILLKNYNVSIETVKYNNMADNVLNIIPVFIINLVNNKTRRQYIKHIMNKMKINYTLIIVNEIEQLVYNNLDKSKILIGKNKLGCVVSHLYCLNLGIKSNSDKFVIFEDDIIFHKNLDNLLNIDTLNYDFDMLMLGACDFNFKDNFKNVTTISNLNVYKPTKNVLGAHANIYSSVFAKELYEYKLNNVVREYDVDIFHFYDKRNIYVCLPNIVVCELSTTNLNHNYGPKHTLMNRSYIDRCLPTNFSYSDYNYIIIDLIDYIKQTHILKSDVTFHEIIDKYVEHVNMNNEKIYDIKKNLLNGNYTIDDLREIIRFN
jgi:GR25 family glycosyltransferase involved in LPS biosynthesis